MLSVKKVFTNSIKQFFLIFLLLGILPFVVKGQISDVTDIRPLPVNKTIEREIKAAEEHFYTVELKEGEVLRLELEEGQYKNEYSFPMSNILRLIKADDGQIIKEAYLTAITIYGREAITYIAATKESLKVLVKASGKRGHDKYKLTALISEKATDSDKENIKAEELTKRAEKSLKFPAGSSVTDIRKASLRTVKLLGEALSLHRKQGNKYWEAWTLDFLGYIYITLLDFSEGKQKIEDAQKAINYYNQVLQLIKTDKNKIVEAAILLKIANLRSLNEPIKAIDDYNIALKISRESRNFVVEANSFHGLCKIYKTLQQNEKLRDCNKQRLLNTQKRKDIYGEVFLLEGIASSYNEDGQYELAINYYERALFLWQRLHNSGAYPSFSVFNSSDYGDFWSKFQNHSYKFKFKYSEAITLKKLMLLQEKLNNKQLAIVYGKQALNIIQEIRSNIKDLDKESQKLFLDFHEPTYRFLANLLIEEGRFPEAQTVLDLLKEEEFKQIVRRSGEPLFTLPYSRLEEAALTNVDHLAALGRELSDLKDKPKDSLSTDETKRLNEIESVEIPAANKALRQAAETLSTVAPDVKNALDLKMKDNIQNILPALGKGVVALYTVIGKTTVNEDVEDNTAGSNSVNKPANKTTSNKINVGWILLVTPEFRKAYPIDTKDLEQTVFKFREALRSPNYDPQPLAQELYKKLFLQTSDKQKTTLATDLETYLGKEKDKTLMWSLDGVLRYVPMAALHDGKDYLVEKYRNVVFNTASLGSLKDAVKPNWEVVGLGVSTEGTVKAYDGRMLHYPALKGSEGELNSIIKEKNKNDTEGIFPGTLKINSEFTKEALFEGARTGMPVIHISSHFWFNPAQEDTSFLLLGNSQRLEVTEFQDYPNLFSSVDFLSLSACDTATGGNANNSNKAVGKAENDEKARDSNGKEIEGFAYVAQTLGAKSVMASLWQVSDRGTKELMLKFYQIKKEQPELPKGEALRQAQLSLLRGTTKSPGAEGVKKDLVLLEDEVKVEGLKPFNKNEKMPFAHPYYWSSFVLIGNWR